MEDRRLGQGMVFTDRCRPPAVHQRRRRRRSRGLRSRHERGFSLAGEERKGLDRFFSRTPDDDPAQTHRPPSIGSPANARCRSPDRAPPRMPEGTNQPGSKGQRNPPGAAGKKAEDRVSGHEQRPPVERPGPSAETRKDGGRGKVQAPLGQDVDRRQQCSLGRRRASSTAVDGGDEPTSHHP